jgi:hypothetical protein
MHAAHGICTHSAHVREEAHALLTRKLVPCHCGNSMFPSSLPALLWCDAHWQTQTHLLWHGAQESVRIPQRNSSTRGLVLSCLRVLLEREFSVERVGEGIIASRNMAVSTRTSRLQGDGHVACLATSSLWVSKKKMRVRIRLRMHAEYNHKSNP